MDPWLTTYSGRKFIVTQATEDDIFIEDIAHALSNICRFGGHCQKFYSVAEHCCRLCDIVEDDAKLAALLHDAPEALTGTADVPSLIKHRLLSEICLIEGRLLGIIYSKYKVNEVVTFRPAFHQAERALLATEVRDLMVINHLGWELLVEPLLPVIHPWGPKMAEHEYLRRFSWYV